MNRSFAEKMSAVFLMAFIIVSCRDSRLFEERLGQMSVRIDALEQIVETVNNNAIALRMLVDRKTLIVSYRDTGNGYSLELSDGTVIEITDGINSPYAVPVISIDGDGWWIVSVDGGETFVRIAGADNACDDSASTPQLTVDGNGFWMFSVDGGDSWDYIRDGYCKEISAIDGEAVRGDASVFANVEIDEENQLLVLTLKNDGRRIAVDILLDFYFNIVNWTDGVKLRKGESLQYEIEHNGVRDAVVMDAPSGWMVDINGSLLSIVPSGDAEAGVYPIELVLVSEKGLVKSRPLEVEIVDSPLATGCLLWDRFILSDEGNLLLDYSYAGYRHGEYAPADVWSLGYRVYDIRDYGGIPDDGLSDRKAFDAAYKAAMGTAVTSKASAKAIIYFPEGEWILHTSDDNVNGASMPLVIQAGDIVLKGAGRDRTTIVMQDPNLPEDETMLYSSPVMMEFQNPNYRSSVTRVTSDAPKGTFSIDVASASNLAAGDVVVLEMTNNDPEAIASQLYPYAVETSMTGLTGTGVSVIAFYEIKSIADNRITFVEPLMCGIDASWNWEVKRFPHYSNVGIEDITFKGNAKPDFRHHGDWEYDGAFKPIEFSRLTDSWIRRCRFTSVSEAVTMVHCANCSVYDIVIDGNTGHSAIRSQASSRVFIGAVEDVSGNGSGQWHGSGVSHESSGTVLWRNRYGDNSFFECHASQPRATLVDCCHGGWAYGHQGGSLDCLPNHMADLVIWNYDSSVSCSGEWQWWSGTDRYQRFLPPVIAGFHGAQCIFAEGQCLADESHGTAVEPGSLYEAQMKARLGYLPGWINTLRN